MSKIARLVSYEDTKAHIGTLPRLEPRLNATNLNAMKKPMEALQTIPSWSSPEHGYTRTIVFMEEYNLTGRKMSILALDSTAF